MPKSRVRQPKSNDSQARFTTATKDEIRETYNNRCGICLQKLSDAGSHCAHLLESATGGAKKVHVAVGLGVVSPNYGRSSAENGMVLCPTCHLGLLTSDHIVLSPSPHVLEYIEDYLLVTDEADQKPLHEVFRLLNDASQGVDVDLPNTTSVQPYMGLFTIVPLKPDELQDLRIVTHCRPKLSVLRNNKFVKAPANAQPDLPNAARIFDVMALKGSVAGKNFDIHLSPGHPEHQRQHYWRLPARSEVILMMLMERIVRVSFSGIKEIDHARAIYGILSIRKSGIDTISVTRKRESDGEANDEPPRKVSRPQTSKSTVRKGASGSKSRPPQKATKSGRSGLRPRKVVRLKI